MGTQKMPQHKTDPVRRPNNLSRPSDIKVEYESGRVSAANTAPQLKDSQFERRSDAMVNRWQSAAAGTSVDPPASSGAQVPDRHRPDRIVARDSSQVAATRMDILAGHLVEPRKVLPIM